MAVVVLLVVGSKCCGGDGGSVCTVNSRWQKLYSASQLTGTKKKKKKYIYFFMTVFFLLVRSNMLRSALVSMYQKPVTHTPRWI